MAKQLYYEDVEVGMEMPPLVKRPTTQTLVKWAGACGDFYQIHYDKDFAIGTGLPGIIVHGALKGAWLGQYVVDFVGLEGNLRKLSCQYRGMDVPNDTLTCKGRVTNKYVKDGEHCIECEIWVENSRGEKTTPATAIAILPSRS